MQTVILHASSPYISKGWPLWRRPHFPLVYRARLGQRFIVEGPANRVFARARGVFPGGTGQSVRHAVLMPSYNTGPVLARTVRDAVAAWPDVFVVLDGSTDGSEQALAAAPGLRVLRLAQTAARVRRSCTGCARRRPRGSPMPSRWTRTGSTRPR